MEDTASKETPLLPSISSTLLSSVHPVFYPQLPLAHGSAGPHVPQLCYYTMPFYFPPTTTAPFHMPTLTCLEDEGLIRTHEYRSERGRVTHSSLTEDEDAAETDRTSALCEGHTPDKALIFKEQKQKPENALSISFVLSDTEKLKHHDVEKHVERKKSRLIDIENESSPDFKPKLTEAEKDLLRAAHSSFSSNAPHPLSPPHSSLAFSTPSFSHSSFQPQPSVMYLPSSSNASSHPVPFGQPFSISSSFSLPYPPSPPVSLSLSLASPSTLSFSPNTPLSFVPSISTTFVKPAPASSNNKKAVSNNTITGTVFGDYTGNGSASEGVAKRRANLSKVATDRLKQWLFENLNHPYPTEEEKATLCHETGLQLEQVCNWFINARRRIVQPMLENAQKGKPSSLSTGSTAELLSECVLLSKKSEKKRKKEETDSDD